ncbi:CrcB family protein [Gleimia hominis]|uniref:Fluoride-specific ion channel FluC n=1 Tax=Gleimia hominis TaxID=595468 RepID=A0ABU3I8E6_9ACTO|nr:CrcB family protein [Gleimia hominis]MDT3766660.1 CrcB family protein [Gleimia hominis]
MIAWILLPFAGGFGALCRYATELRLRGFLSAHTGSTTLSPYLDEAARTSVWRISALAWPIMLINLIGSFVMGVLFGFLSQYAGVWLVVATGFLGGYTTFSTAMMDVYTMARVARSARTWVAAFLTCVGTAVLCVLTAGFGLWLST